MKTQFDQSNGIGKEQTDTAVRDAVNSQDWTFFKTCLRGNREVRKGRNLF